MRILDALLNAMDERGFSISVTVNGQQAITRAHVLDEIVPFHLEERIGQATANPPRERPHEAWAPRPETRPVPTGALEFYIDAEWPLVQGDIRRSWRDGKQQRVEDCLGKILAGFVAAAHALRADRLAREERERQWKAEERRRRYSVWEARQEKRRREALQAELESWHLCRDLRAYLQVRQTRAAPAAADVDRWEAWVGWIAKYADGLEAQLVTAAGPDPEPFDENAYYY
jgi:hypothetical protein